MAKGQTFVSKFTSVKKNEEKLSDFLQKADPEEVSEAIVTSAGDDIGLSLFSAVLTLLEDEEVLFELVKDVLPKLNRDQLSTKVINDFYNRLTIELPRYSRSLIVRMAYFCENHIQFGDPRAAFFKDILPCCLQILLRSDCSITIDGVTKSSAEHHEEIISSVLNKPFKPSILASITSMFKDIPLNKLKTEILMGKICENFPSVPQSDIPRLALACFNLSLFTKLVIPVLALDTYFFNKRYMKKFIELESESDLNSIDATAEKGVIETEENVIYHFQQVTEFTSIEKDIVSSLKPLAFAPKFIISPFIATVLVSFAKMSSSSVAGNLRLPQSILLPFMKQVFKNNERHRKILQSSAWARSVDQFVPMDIDKLLRVIQENTCKLGQNVALNGFIGLTFMLLKTKNAPALNNFGVQFLNELVKQRQEFASDIMKILVKMLFTETNKAPIIECFSTMALRKSLPIDRCEEALKELIENLTELELETAMAIETAIHNIIIRSSRLRDLMTKTMRAAMYQNNPEMRKLAIHSFCAMLKKVKKPKGNEIFGASQNISMMSLMSQSQLPSIGNFENRRVSVLVLEILGLLKKCFSHNADIRVTLYENLLGAVAANEIVVPNVLELVETYFRDYFDNEDPEIFINFTKVFKELDTGEIIVTDHIGKFLNFFVGCVMIAQESATMDEDNVQLNHFKQIFSRLMSKVEDATLDQLGAFSTLNLKSAATIEQFLNCIEALMEYCCLNLTENVGNITKLFAKHSKITAEALKLQENCKKSMKRGKNQTDVGGASKKIELNLTCVWSLKTCVKFLKIVFEPSAREALHEIKQNKELVRFIVKSASHKILQLGSASEFHISKHSRSSFLLVIDVATIFFKQLKVLKTIYTEFDEETAVAISEGFKNIIFVMDSLQNDQTKWQVFLQKMQNLKSNSIDFMIMEILKVCQQNVEWIYDEDTEFNEKIVLDTFTTIELLFKNFISIPNAHTRDTYHWLLQFCQSQEVNQKSLHIVNRILFQFMAQQDASCTMMEKIARKFSSIYGQLDEEEENSQDDFKSITKDNADLTFFSFASMMKKQIDDVEFCILRMNSYNAHVKIPGQASRDESKLALQNLEKSCVIQLTDLGKVLGHFCNTRFNTHGNQLETVGKLGISYFTCLWNLMRHFTQRFNIKDIDYGFIPLEGLMRESKRTVTRIYALTPYVQDVHEVESKKIEKEKKKLVAKKELKYNARLVAMVEKFSSAVGKFDKLSKKNFTRLLHTGDLRGFRIKDTGIAQMEISDEDDEAVEDVGLSEEDSSVAQSSEDEEVTRKNTRRTRNRIMESDESEAEKSDSGEDDAPPLERFNKNLEKISEEARKKAAAKGRKKK